MRRRVVPLALRALSVAGSSSLGIVKMIPSGESMFLTSGHGTLARCIHRIEHWVATRWPHHFVGIPSLTEGLRLSCMPCGRVVVEQERCHSGRGSNGSLARKVLSKSAAVGVTAQVGK